MQSLLMPSLPVDRDDAHGAAVAVPLAVVMKARALVIGPSLKTASLKTARLQTGGFGVVVGRAGLRHCDDDKCDGKGERGRRAVNQITMRNDVWHSVLPDF